MIRLKKDIKAGPGPFNRGVDAYNQRDFFVAAKELRKAVDAHPTYPDYRFALAMAQRELGELDLAVESLRCALKINANYIQAKIELAILLAIDGERKEAAALYGDVVKRMIYNTDGVPGAAAGKLLETFDEGIAQLDEGEYAAAVLAFRRAVNPKSSMPEMHFNQAIEYSLQEDLESAKVELDQALKLDPYHIDAYILSCQIARIEGDHEKALEACQKAIEIAPEYPDLHYHLALTCLELGEAEQAREELEHTLRLQPEYDQALLELAELAIETEDFERAEQCLKDYTDSGSSEARYNYLMGLLFEEQGKYHEASIYYQHVRDDSRWASAARERLVILKNLSSNGQQ